MEYDWGSESKECLISELTHKNCKKYAELWMGTHSNGPSMLDEEKSLLQYLK
jgi:mannose-6-phosphate isomerase class I